MRALSLCVLVCLAGCAADEDDELTTATETAAVSVTWTNVVGVSTSGNSLTKTAAGSSWNAGAVSVETLVTDGYVEFTTAEATTQKTAGLSNGDAGQGFADIDFAIRLRANGTVGIFEFGVLLGNEGTYVAGDVFRVQVKGGVITYWKNGAVLRTSTATPTFPLLVDTSLYAPGATINNVNLVATGITWQNLVGVSATGNDLVKTAGTTSWTAGASTVQTLTGDGFAEFLAAETTTARAAGLSAGDDNQSYTDIDYAVRLGLTGTATIWEAGVQKFTVGTYYPNDRFRIELVGTSVRYSRNGELPFYTSAVAATFPLRFDTAFLTPGGTIKDVELTVAADACPAHDGTGVVCTGSFTIENSFDVAEIANCAVITGDLIFSGGGMVELSLPKLERLEGELRLGFTVEIPDFKRLRLPALKHVGALWLGFPSVPQVVDLSRLKTMSDMFYIHSPTGVPVLTSRCLQHGGSIETEGPGSINAPALETMSGTLWGKVVAPLIRYIGGSVYQPTLNAPLLTEIGGTLEVHSTQVIPALERAGGLTIVPSQAGPWDFSGIVEVGALRVSCGSVQYAFPALEHATRVEVCSTTDLPQLATITGDFVDHDIGYDYGLEVSGTTPFEAPSLTEIGRRGLSIGPPGSFPVLTRIGGSLGIGSSFEAPVLTEVTGKVHVTGASVLSAPVLATIGGPLIVQTTSVGSVSLPSLTSVKAITLGSPAITAFDAPLLVSAEGMIRAKGTSLSSLSLPSLVFCGTLDLTNNDDMTSIDFPALTSVGTLLQIRANFRLPNCYATNLRDQLFAAGWSGSVNITGNQGTGACP